jgi:hypothetical protein
MSDESALAVTAGPEGVTPEPGAIITTTEGQTEGQVAEGAEDAAPEEEAKKTAAKERRERDKAFKDRLAAERDAALEEVRKAEDRRARILGVGKADKPPAESDYIDPLEYVAAKAVWAAQQKAIERDAGEAGAAAEEARRKAEDIKRQEDAAIAQSWRDRVAEAKTRYADFEAVAMSGDVPIPQSVARLVATSDVGPDVAYYLGQNKALAAQIANLNPVEQARAIGRIEATISAPHPRQTTTAPPPINPVRGKAAPGKSPEEMSPDEYAKWRSGGGTFKLR